MSKSEALARRLADHGRHLFVYNHIWTNQVVYSLERSMKNNQVLKQLAFAGKQTLPASLRKDMWRPLMTVTFPSPPQGLHAFRKLREYRRLHELHWTEPEPKDNKPALPGQIRKQRSAIIMDQKANTVADLAQVLLEQEELGMSKTESHKQAQEAAHQRAREDMFAMRQEVENGGLTAVEQALNEQREVVRALRQSKRNKTPDAPSNRVLLEASIALRSLRLKHEKMMAAKHVFDNAEAQASSASEATDKAVDVEIETPEIFYKNLDAQGRKSGAQDVPLYTADGVVIRWSNPLDAEYAGSWPNAVRHEAAGLARHTATQAVDEPVFEVADLVLRNTSRKYRELRAARDAAAVETADFDGADLESADQVSEELLAQQDQQHQPTTRA